MMYKKVIFMLSLIIPCSSSYANADKSKNKHNKRTSIEMSTLEPDRLAAKPRKARTATEPSEIMLRQKAYAKYKEGIDVSHYQGQIDWDAVMANEKISYVYLKATEGASLIDDTYARNLSEAKRVGLMVGSYHYYHPNIDWHLQIQNMSATIKPGEQDLIPIIDIEDRGGVSDEKFIADLEDFIAEVTRIYGARPLLYTFHNFYNRHLVGTFKNHHWMIARYKSDLPILSDGKEYIIWQYTSKGRVSGIRGHVDRSKLMDGFSLSQLLM